MDEAQKWQRVMGLTDNQAATRQAFAVRVQRGSTVLSSCWCHFPVQYFCLDFLRRTVPDSDRLSRPLMKSQTGRLACRAPWTFVEAMIGRIIS